MQPFILLGIILTLLDFVTAFRSEIELNVTRIGDIGADLQVNRDHVNQTNEEFIINPQSQDGFDLHVQIKWGFHISFQSTITIIMDGFTPNITSIDGEFLMVFSVDDKQYFSVANRLQDKAAWKIYPGITEYLWTPVPLATSSSVFANIIASTNPPGRYERVSGNDNFVNIKHEHNTYKDPLIWPFQIQIVNDPINDTTTYFCINDGTILKAIFNTSFAANKGLDVFIMNDASDNKPFDIDSIHIIYEYTTPSPTTEPTNEPTNIPTINPSIQPSPIPTTLIPTLYLQTTQSNRQGVDDISTTLTSDFNEPDPTSLTNDNMALINKVIIVTISAAVFISICIIGVIIYKCCINNKLKNEAARKIRIHSNSSKVNNELRTDGNVNDIIGYIDLQKDQQEILNKIGIDEQLKGHYGQIKQDENENEPKGGEQEIRLQGNDMNNDEMEGINKGDHYQTAMI